MRSARTHAAPDDSARLTWRAGSVEQRLSHALVHGITEINDTDTDECWASVSARGGRPLHVIEGPLLIGGATTSRVHTAVKIAPHYEGPVVYVPDASRSVGVCSDLLSDERAAKYVADLNAEYERVRQQHASRKVTPLVSLAAARANKTPVDWTAYTPPRPAFLGRRVFRNQDLSWAR